MNTLLPGEVEALLALTVGLLGVWVFALYLLRRLYVQEILNQGRVTRASLEDLGQLLMTKMDEKFDEMEAAQARREEGRTAYLLKNAEVLGGLSSANQLLTGQLATLSAKLDRQIELSRTPKPEA